MNFNIKSLNKIIIVFIIIFIKTIHIDINSARAKDLTNNKEILMSDNPFATDDKCYIYSQTLISDIPDPWEKYNRKIWIFNKKLNRFIVIPIIKVYRGVLFHQNMRDGMSNFLNNLNEPLYMLNYLLQGEIRSFFSSFNRFILNSTVGILGFSDFASKHGLKRQKSTFGDTFLKFGGKQCNYIILPLLGPHSMTRAIGLGFDIAFYPIDILVSETITSTLLGLNIINIGNNVLNKEYDQLNFIDDYSVVKSTYTQYYTYNY
ncbi:MlaA family lipoprotein [Lyticum sinuosum]|uniref:VacJ family lipoprotein n=1 Tax=Lyticum sinuosum TaxID=1332059 RepID=A0AAE4VM04_9RICK|nr:VacJ family lipoprotein [Lyticum sinuosum]MDZ5761336.1 VacJ family lipoprotein [Lyticum sinuosum]